MNSIEEKLKRSSFHDKVKAGWTKEQLMEYYKIDQDKYERIISCLNDIHGQEVKS